MSSMDLAAASERELTDGIQQLNALRTSSHAHLLRFIASYDERFGSNQTPGALSALIDVPVAAARRWVETARALRRLPAIAARFEDGSLSYEKVAALAQVATPETDADLAREAGELSVADIRRVGAKLKAAERTDNGDGHPDRHLLYRWDAHHTRLTLNGELYGAAANVFVLALEREMDDLPRRVDRDGEMYSHRAADALVNLASGAIAQDSDRATLVVHADLSLLTGEERGLAETASGTPLHPDSVARLACDAAIEVAVHNDEGRVVGIGRKARTVPGWLRRQLVKRDRHCRFPGCNNTRFLDAHHLHHWSAGGSTDLDNLGLLCRAHHVLVHRQLLKIELDPITQEMKFSRPDGSAYAHGPPPLRDDFHRRFFGPLVPV